MLHIQRQLGELRLEESAILFRDTAVAVGQISAALLPLIKEEEQSLSLLEAMASMREGISKMIDAYEVGQLTPIEQVLAQVLIPAFQVWRERIEKQMRPSVLA